jgi:hypothetical protein
MYDDWHLIDQLILFLFFSVLKDVLTLTSHTTLDALILNFKNEMKKIIFHILVYVALITVHSNLSSTILII